MPWENQLVDLFEDLELQAEGLALAQRDADVAGLSRAEYAEVTLDGRIHASVGRDVELVVRGAGALRGRLAGVGAGWCLLGERSGGSRAQEWIVVLSALLGARGIAPGARPPATRAVTARLGVASVVRRLSEERASVLVVTPDGTSRRGLVGRVGADFFEVSSADAGLEIVPLGAVAALRSVG